MKTPDNLPKLPHVPNGYAELIKAFRKRYNITQMQLADIMGVAFPTINRWENRRCKPHPLFWQHLLNVATIFEKDAG